MPFDYDDLTKHFGLIWPVHLRGFTELLIVMRKHFGGDLDLMLVLAIVGSRTLPSRRVDGLSYAEFMDGRRRDWRPDPINVQSISDCSGIPRETVRRKVGALQASGWIVRHEEGYLMASEAAARDLAPVTEATFQYLAAIGRCCVDAVSGKMERGAGSP
jgi:hypothetical protein